MLCSESIKQSTFKLPDRNLSKIDPTDVPKYDLVQGRHPKTW